MADKTKSCFESVSKAISGQVPEGKQAEVDALTRAFDQALNDIAENVQREGGSLTDFRKKANAYKQKVLQEQGINRKAILESKKKQLMRNEFYSQFEDKEEAVLALLTGSTKVLKGARSSADAVARQTTNKFLQVLESSLNDIEINGQKIDGHRYLKEATQQQQKNIAIELHELRKGGKPGSTGDEVAKAVAGEIKKYQNYQLQRIREAGGQIGELDDYIFQQTHSKEKILAVGKTQWAEQLVDGTMLDHDRTFGPAMNREQKIKKLENIADHITGVGAKEDQSPYQSLVILNNRETAKNPYKSRVIHFKDGESFFLYNQSFGEKGVYEAVVASAHNSGRIVGLTEKFGPDFEAEIKGDFTRLGLEQKTGRKPERQGIWHEILTPSPMDAFKEVAGITSRGSHSSLAKLGANFRAWQSISKLGGAVVASANDISTAATLVANRTGKNMLDVHRELVVDWLNQFPKEKRREAAKKLGLVFEDFLMHENAKYGIIDSQSTPGWAARAQAGFFKWNGLHAQTQTARLTVGGYMNRELAEVSTRSFTDLPEQWKGTLKAYDISEPEFNKFKDFLETFNERTFIDEEKLRVADSELYGKFMVMLSDIMHAASPEPDAKTRALFIRGTEADTIMGQVARMIYQFKGVPMYLAHTVTPMTVRAGTPNATPSIGQYFDPRQPAFKVLAGSVLSYTAIGYLTLSLKDMAKGNEPRDPFSVRTMKDAMQFSGAAGIYGDFLMGEMHKYGGGGGILKTLAGPGISEAVDAASMMKKIFDDAPENAQNPRIVGNLGAGEVIRFAQRNTPFANMVYAKWALDNTIVKGLYDVLGEDYDGYMDRKLDRQRDARKGFLDDFTGSEEGQGRLLGE